MCLLMFIGLGQNLGYELENCSCKGLIVNILGFVDYMVC